MSGNEPLNLLVDPDALDEIRQRHRSGDEEEVGRLVRILETVLERERSLVELLGAPYVITDTEGKIRHASDVGREFLESHTAADLVGRRLEEWISEPRRPAFREQLARLRDRRRPLVFESTVVLLNREPVPVEITASSVRGLDGSVTHVQWLLRNIRSERRADQTSRALVRSEAERAAAERAERRYSILSDASKVLAQYFGSTEPLQEVTRLVVREHADHCGIWIRTEGDLREIAAAGDVRSDSGFLPERKRLRLDPDDPEGALARAVAEGREYVVARSDPSETAAVSPAGEVESDAGGSPRRALVVPLKGSAGIEGALTLVDLGVGPGFGREDLMLANQLADRIVMAEERARLYGVAVRAQGERDHVRKVVSHDLRNALNALTMSLEQVGVAPEDRPAGEGWRPTEEIAEASVGSPAETDDGHSKMEKWLMRVHQAAGRMSRLIDDLDQLTEPAPPTSMILGLDTEACEPRQLLEHAAEMFEARAMRRDVSLEQEVDPDAPAVEADRDRIGQVLSNLIDNALRVTPSGGRVVLGASPGERHVLFSVEDTGPGIPDEDLPRVFGPGDRGEHGGQSGLGLAIVRHLVEAHGGAVRAESPEGAGARVVFTLPNAGSGDGP